MGKTFRIRVYEGGEIRGPGQSDEFPHIFRSIPEVLAALFEYPHSANILEKAYGPVHSPFVGEVLPETVVGNDRSRSLDSKQGPGAATKICKVSTFGRDGCNG